MKLSALLQKNSRKKRRERYRYGYGWKKVGKNCSNKLVPYEYIKSYSIFVLAFAQPWSHLQHFCCCCCWNDIYYLFITFVLFFCLEVFGLNETTHTLRSTQQKANKRLNLCMERGWGERERPKAKNTEKKRWINVRNFLLLQWLLGDDRHTQT